jgi:hypothetical protein
MESPAARASQMAQFFLDEGFEVSWDGPLEKRAGGIERELVQTVFWLKDNAASGLVGGAAYAAAQSAVRPASANDSPQSRPRFKTTPRADCHPGPVGSVPPHGPTVITWSNTCSVSEERTMALPQLSGSSPPRQLLPDAEVPAVRRAPSLPAFCASSVTSRGRRPVWRGTDPRVAGPELFVQAPLGCNSHRGGVGPAAAPPRSTQLQMTARIRSQ